MDGHVLTCNVTSVLRDKSTPPTSNTASGVTKTAVGTTHTFTYVFVCMRGDTKDMAFGWWDAAILIREVKYGQARGKLGTGITHYWPKCI